MIKKSGLIFLGLMLMTAASIAGNPGAGDYLPLESGWVYEYRCVLVRGGQEVVKEKVTVSCYAAEQFPGKNLVMRRLGW